MIEPKKTSRPAQKYGNRGAWQAEADHLRAHPNETFIIERRAYPDKAMYALAAHVRAGGYVAFRPKGSFDAWVEREQDALEVIATYLGEAAQEAQDSATAVDPEPARKRRTVMVRAGDAAPESGQGAMAAPEPEPAPETVPDHCDGTARSSSPGQDEASSSKGYNPLFYVYGPAVFLAAIADKRAPLAFHEAGHAIACCAVGRPFRYVSLRTKNKNVAGHVTGTGFARRLKLGETWDTVRRDDAFISAAGPIAGYLFNGCMPSDDNLIEHFVVAAEAREGDGVDQYYALLGDRQTLSYGDTKDFVLNHARIEQGDEFRSADCAKCIKNNPDLFLTAWHDYENLVHRYLSPIEYVAVELLVCGRRLTGSQVRKMTDIEMRPLGRAFQ